MTTFPVAAYCFASTQTDAYPLASVVAGRRSITNPGSLIGATNTKPFVLKYTVWPDIGWRFPSRSWTVSGGLKVESTVSDRPAPDTIFRPARGPLVSPQAARPNARLRMKAPRPTRGLATTMGVLRDRRNSRALPLAIEDRSLGVAPVQRPHTSHRRRFLLRRRLRRHRRRVGGHLPEQRPVALPRVENHARLRATGLRIVLAQQLEHDLLVRRLERSYGDHVGVTAGRKRFGIVEHVSRAVRHPRGEVAPHGPEHDHDAGRHVFATVGASTFDHRGRPGVAHGEPVPRPPRGEQRSGGRPVQRGVTQEDVLVGATRGCRLAERPDHDLAAREPLADVVVRFPLELEVHPREGERSETLPRGPAEAEANRSLGQADVAEPLGDPAGDARAHRQVVIADVVHARERAAGVEPRRERVENLVVQRLHSGTVVARRRAAPR